MCRLWYNEIYTKKEGLSMSNAEQIINLVSTLDEDTCQLVLTFINDLKSDFSENPKKSFDISLMDKIDNLIQQVQSVGEISDCTADELAASYLEDKYNL